MTKKEKFNKILKEDFLSRGNGFYDRDLPYSPEYQYYFRKSILDCLTKKMLEKDLLAYQNGQGKELVERKNGEPAKFLSIASSSRFCYSTLSMKDKEYTAKPKTGADYFSFEDDQITNSDFETLLPIKGVRGKQPEIDCYCITKKAEYFFECKCQELFDSHNRQLSKQYFNLDNDLIVDYIPKEFLIEKNGKIEVSGCAFGVSEKPIFDIKQLLTHLMGIICNKKRSRCKFIYLYNVPDFIVDKKILDVKNALIDEIKTIFKEDGLVMKYMKEHNIAFECYFYQQGAFDYLIEGNFVKKII